MRGGRERQAPLTLAPPTDAAWNTDGRNSADRHPSGRHATTRGARPPPPPPRPGPGFPDRTRPLTIDLYLPALPHVSTDLHVSQAVTRLTLTAFMAGIALGQLVIGPLSDTLGRRRPLLTGLSVYVVAGALCALAPDPAVLIGMRLIQGLAGAAGIVIARAVVRDLYDGLAAARLLSSLMLVSGPPPLVQVDIECPVRVPVAVQARDAESRLRLPCAGQAAQRQAQRTHTPSPLDDCVEPRACSSSRSTKHAASGGI
ncbi:MFS transporter [Streptomyces sp. NPDC020951]|uniref:MFS transporter n=1 Tax=Streptomyces sp. NPDC020951 TaxID=3365104 RepID=UPI0037B65105